MMCVDNNPKDMMILESVCVWFIPIKTNLMLELFLELNLLQLLVIF